MGSAFNYIYNTSFGLEVSDMKRIVSIFLVLVLVVNINSVFSYTSNSSAKENTLKVDTTKKIYDYADLFSEDEEENLFLQANEYIENYSMDLAIVTINENNKTSSRAYADDFYDYNNFGIGTGHDGILLLIDMDNRIAWISTTGKAISVYTDKRIDTILDDVEIGLKSSNYYKAAESFINTSGKFASSGVRNTYIDSFSDGIMFFLKCAIIPTIITVVIILIGWYSHRNVRKATSASIYMKKDTFKLYNKQNNFVNTYTSRVYSPRSSGSGGSSTHTSSSGRSHGGGGRGF